MAIPLGKLTLLLGAGIVGSVLSQEGHASKVTGFISSALKSFYKHIHQGDSGGPSKSQSDTLLAQVNSLKQELQMLASSKPVTIVTGGGSGGKGIRVPVLIVISGVLGYGYVRWKGWKLSDMMFATRRSLFEACTTVGKQLDHMQSSISAAKRHLSMRIDHVDHNLDQCAEIGAATKDQVSSLRGDLRGFVMDVESVQRAVYTLETKLGQIEEKQDLTNLGVHHLVGFVSKLEEKGNVGPTEASISNTPERALEPPRIVPPCRALSLPATVMTNESPSSSSSETPKFSRFLQETSLASGLKDLQEISAVFKATESESSNDDPIAYGERGGISRSGSLGLKMRGLNGSLIARACTATGFFKQACI